MVIKHYYSSNRNAFYPAVLRPAYERSGKWPKDIVEVTDDEWQTYGLEQPPAGMQRSGDENGKPCWVTLPPEEMDQLAARKRAEMDASRDTAFAAGMPFTFPNGSEDLVQIRLMDRSNLLGIAINARELHAANVTDSVIEFRAASNTTYALTPSEAIEMTNAAHSHIEGIYRHSWQLKDTIEAALATGDRKIIEEVAW